ncbi:Thiamine-phosphate synthase [Pseudovibrio sp. Ad13]|uniref:thiamine phosphate synthase n=1 Tax=unclassified Pseudovibrio TaxID=2627060 RepID=UPI0007AEDBF2|nr:MULTISPECIES: thiamine phosphate synthase [unclassified Pseudovibrio]KZK86628.1 Thiamine-phosphate synthase [Pseudovibrio sp. Ad13]KZL01529.1 Thiamine-phosphate synthase [Pseudovibrio sp. Ad5]
MERFYLIAGDADWIEQLVPHGVKLVQLRIKDQPEQVVRLQIAQARDYCRQHGVQLIINDYWELALELGCDFVHLGQEDMDSADFAALQKAGVRFGLSTHDEAELDRALSFKPEYVALGPVYPTKLKKMKWAPQGLERVSRWKQMVGKTPLVAIGGLTPERLAGVFEAGADSAAVVTDILQAHDPITRTQEWVEACKQ